MSNRSKNRSKQVNKIPIVQEPKKYSAKDAFENQLARLGINSPNLLSATNYPLTRLSRDYNLLNSLYRSHWIIKKIINTIPEDMIKNWVDITAEMDPKDIDRFSKLEQKTQIKDKLLEGLMWGRLYGGAACIIMIEGQDNILDKPLIAKDVLPNTFKGLMVVDRWSGIFPDITLVSDINDPEFGLPDTYEVRDIGTERLLTRIHHSRVIRCIGRKLPFWEDLAEIHWGSSEVEHIYDELVKRDNTSWNIASLVFQANLLVDKIEGFEQLQATNDVETQRQIYNTKSAQNQMRNNNGMMLVGAKEEITALQYSFAGLNDIYESFMLDIAGASEIPVTKLFGRSPAGMNATGESDLQNYYDMIAQQQETVLRPKLNKLFPIMFMSEFGYIPDDLDFNFNAVSTPTEDKLADIVSKKTASILDAYAGNLISQRIGAKELHELSYTTKTFSSIDDDFIASCDDKVQSNDLENMNLGGTNPDADLPNKPTDKTSPELNSPGFTKKGDNIAKEGEKSPIHDESSIFSLPTETTYGNNLTEEIFEQLPDSFKDNKNQR